MSRRNEKTASKAEYFSPLQRLSSLKYQEGYSLQLFSPAFLTFRSRHGGIHGLHRGHVHDRGRDLEHVHDPVFAHF